MKHITEEEKLEEKQIAIVKKAAKKYNWYISQEDKYNFHIVTDDGLILKHSKYIDFMGKSKQIWFLINKNNEKTEGDYKTITNMFLKEYNNSI